MTETIIILSSLMVIFGGVSCFCIKKRNDQEKERIALLDIKESNEPYTSFV